MNLKKLSNNELKIRRKRLLSKIETIEQEALLCENMYFFYNGYSEESPMEIYKDTLINTIDLLMEILRRDASFFETEDW